MILTTTGIPIWTNDRSLLLVSAGLIEGITTEGVSIKVVSKDDRKGTGVINLLEGGECRE